MHKFAVFFAVLAVASAKPGFFHGGHGGYIAAPVAIPAAISHSSRVDIHSSPVAVVKSAPVVAVHAAPAVVAAPIAHGVVAAPYGYATSHSARYDVHHSVPVLSSYGGYGYGHGGYGYGGLAHGAFLAGHGLHGW